MSSLQLGGCICDLQNGRAGGMGKGADPLTIAEAVALLREDFKDRQGLRVTIRTRVLKSLVAIVVWKDAADRFAIQMENELETRYLTAEGLFDDLAAILARCCFEWSAKE